MPRHDFQCGACQQEFERVVRWDEREATCACGGLAQRVYRTARVQDDTLTGGPRYMHNLGDTPIWVETKTQLKQIMQERGLVPAERSSYNRDDKSPWATQTRLRPGQRDPFVHDANFNR